MAKDEDDAGSSPAADKKGSSKKLVLIIVGALALVGVSVGGSIVTMKMLSNDEPVKKTAKKKAPAADEEAADAEGEAGGKDKAEGEAETADDEEAPTEPKVATYLDFEHPFVVNFQDEGQMRYLQISVSVMATNPKVIEEVKRHMPLIRNNLVMLFSGQTREGVMSREGKEKIRKDAEAEVQKILKEQTGKPGVKSLYFTSFVMQ
jgi:flagellar FliL protein